MIMTERCKIRYFKPEDLDAFISYRNNLEWMKYQSFKGLSKEEYREFLLNSHNVEEGVQFAVVLRDSDVLIGDLYVKRQEDAFLIGYTLHPCYAGQGLMLEAVTGYIDYLKSEYKCSRVLAGILSDNIRSIKLVKKIGFEYSHFDEENGEDVYILELYR